MVVLFIIHINVIIMLNVSVEKLMVIAEIIFYFIVLILSFFYLSVLKKRDDKLEAETKCPERHYLNNSTVGIALLRIVIFLALSVSLTFLWSYLRNKFMFTEPNSVYIDSHWMITFIPLFPISIALSGIVSDAIILHVKKRRNRAHILGRQSILKAFIVIFAFAFPIVILNTKCYTRVTKDIFFINEFFSVNQVEYRIPDDIQSVQATYWRGYHRGLTYYFYYYVSFNDGRTIELFSQNNYEAENVKKIDRILREHNVQIYREPFSLDQLHEVEKNYIPPLPSYVKEIYIN